MGDAIVWWITLQLLGLAAVPIAAVLLRALPDRGYTLSKPLGLMLTGWLAYTVAMLKIAQFDRLLVTICLLVVAAFSVFLLLRQGRALLYELRDHFTKGVNVRYVVISEVVFALAFIIWAIVRAYNPDIDCCQEKFMDYGFLNAILKSGTFPPNDVWLAGFSINYYYFGYILMAALTALSGVATQVAFNLANVGLFALTALGAFGIVHNLITSRLLVKATRGSRTTDDRRRSVVEEERRMRDYRQRRDVADDRRPMPDSRRRRKVVEEEQPVAGRGRRAEVEEQRPAAGRLRTARDYEPEAPPQPERRQRTAKPAQSTTRQATVPVAPVAANSLPSRRAKTRTIEAEPVVETAIEPHDTEVVTDNQIQDGEETVSNAQRAPESTIRNSDSPAYLPISGTATEARWVPALLSPYLYAVIAALMVVAMGNLTTMFAVHDGPATEGNGFRFCFACNGGAGYDWFGASRVIQDYSTVNGQKQTVGFPTINEFPAFSFLLADMHPHVMALPFVLLVLGLAFALAKRRVIRAGTWRDGVPPGLHAWIGIGLTGLLLGSLYTINTWDFPTYLLVVLGCLAVPYLAAAKRQGLGWRWLQPFIVQVLIIGAFALVTFLPFHLTFKSLVGGQAVQITGEPGEHPPCGYDTGETGDACADQRRRQDNPGLPGDLRHLPGGAAGWLGFEFYSYFKRRYQSRRMA